MKRSIVACLVALSLIGLSAPAAAKTIKLGTLAPAGSPWHETLSDIAQEWREISDGPVELRIYAGGVAGDEPDMVRKMRVGQFQAAALTGAGLSRIAPEVQALQMPMMFASNAEYEYVRSALAPALETILEARGFKVLNWGDVGWVRFFTQQPVVHPDDLKPLKIFTWAGADTAYAEAWKNAGYQPVPLAATEVLTALQSGLINAVPTTPIAALSLQWFGLAKHMTALKWAPLVGATVISTAAWEAIPEGLRPELLRAARGSGVEFQERIKQLDREAIDVMQAHGLTVHAVPPKVAALWEKSARAGYPDIVGTVVPADMIDEVERLREAYRGAGDR